MRKCKCGSKANITEYASEYDVCGHIHCSNCDRYVISFKGLVDVVLMWNNRLFIKQVNS